MTRSVMFAFLIALPATAAAQHVAWKIGATAGGGPSLETASLGGSAGEHLWVTTVFAKHGLVHWKGLEASFIAAALPLVVAAGIEKAGTPHWLHPNPSRTDSTAVYFPEGEGLDLGVGIAPVGLQLSMRLTPAVSFYGEGVGGGVAFARAMPTLGARSLNFLGAAGAGLELGKAGQRTYIIGYRFTHLSNANTALENPGFNAHVIYVGVSLH